MLLLTSILPMVVAFSDSQTVAPGFEVSGKAWSVGGNLLQASLKATVPGKEAGWCFEAAAEAPADAAPPEEFLQESLASDETDSDFPCVNNCVNNVDSLRQAKLTGELVHFLRFEEEPADCVVTVGRDPATGILRLEGNTTVTTKSGLRFRFYTPDGPLPPGTDKGDLRFCVELDPRTVANGLTKQPDRFDLRITPPQVGIGGLTGLSVQGLLDHTLSAFWTLKGDQVGSVVDLKLEIARRIADRKLPFSLLVPLQKRTWQPAAPSP